MRPVYFSTFNLGRMGEEPPSLDEFIDVCRNWMCAPRPGVQKALVESVDFSSKGATSVGEGGMLEILRHREEGDEWFGARLEHADADDPSARWRTEITSVRGPQGAGLRIAIATGFAREETFTPTTRATSRPRLVLDLVDRFGAHEGRPITTRSQRLTQENVHEFLSLLLSPERRLPIVLLSAYSWNDKPVINPGPCAKELVGLAHVYAAANRFPSFDMTEALGRQLSCYEGAIRIYWPGLTKTDDPLKHPLLVRPHALEIDENHAGGLPAYFLSRICRVAIALRPARALRWEEIERRIALKTIEELRKGGDDRQLAELLAQENRTLGGRVRSLEDENLRLQEELEQQTGLAEQWRHSYEEERRKSKQGLRTTKVFTLAPPEDVDEAVRRAQKDFSRRLKCDLLKGSYVKGNPYKDPAAVYNAFKFLATTYAESKIGIKECLDLALACKEECGLDYSLHQSEITMKAYEDEYYLKYKGKKVPLQEHIGKGVSKDPQRSIRIAFFFDKEDKVVIVGFVGQHQRTDQT